MQSPGQLNRSKRQVWATGKAERVSLEGTVSPRGTPSPHAVVLPVSRGFNQADVVTPERMRATFRPSTPISQPLCKA